MEHGLRLRPVAEDDLQLLEHLKQVPEAVGEFDWFGWRDLRHVARDWAEDGLINADRGVLMVDCDSGPLGYVDYRRLSSTPGAFYYEIGITIRGEARGRGYGSTAQSMLAEYIFAHRPVERIEANTDIDNLAEQRALEKAGFTREGVTRAAGWRAGAWRDGVRYSLLRSDLVS